MYILIINDVYSGFSCALQMIEKYTSVSTSKTLVGE